MLLGLLASAAWSLFHVQWQEDLLKDLPSGTRELTAVRSWLGAVTGNEPVLLDVDASRCAQPGMTAAEAAERLSALLPQTQYFKKITSGFSMEDGAELWELITAHLPFLLDPADYPQVRENLNQADKLLADLKQQAMNPFAFGLSAQVGRDPLKLSPWVFRKLQGLADQKVTLQGGHLYSEDGKHVLMFAWPKMAPSNTRDSGAMFGAAEKAVAQIKQELKAPALAIHFTGPHRSYQDNSQQMKFDMSWISIASLIALLGITFVTMRRLWLVPFPLISSLVGISVALTIVGLTQKSYSLIVLALASALLGVTDDYGLHLLHAVERTPNNPVAAARQIRWPVVLGALTTSLTFLTLLFTHFPGQYQLAIFAAIGVLGTAAFALLGLPHIIPKREHPGRPWVDFDKFSTWVDGIGKKHAWIIMLGLAALVLVSIFGCRHLQFLGDPQALNFLTPETRVAEKVFAKAFGEPMGRRFVYLEGQNDNDLLLKAEHLDNAFRAWKQQGVALEGTTLATLIPSAEVQQARRAAFEKEFGPGGRRLRIGLDAAGQRQGFAATAFQLFYQALETPGAPLTVGEIKKAGLETLVEGRLLSNDKGQRVLITPIKLGGALSLERAKQVLAQEVPGAVLVDKHSLVTSILNIIQHDLLPLALLATLVTFLVVFLSTGRLEQVLIVLAPLGAAMLFTFGTMGWLGLQVNLINITVVPLIFGLGTDFALFRMEGVFAKYQQRPFPNGSIYTAALTTLSGFGLLAFAKHPALQSAGLSIVLAIAWALVASLVIVPGVMALFLPGDPAVPPRSLKTVLGGMLIYLSLAFSVIFYLAAILPVLLALRLLGQKKTAHWYLHICAYIIMHYFPYGRRIYYQCDQERFARPCILVGNHEAQVDILLVLSLSAGLRAVVKPWVWNHPILGPLVRGAGFVLATGDNTSEVMEKSKACLEAGHSLVIYPEGSRSKDGIMRRFHKGAFQMAVDTNTLVQPVALVDTRSCTADNTWFIGNHASVITMLEPMDPREFKGEDPATQMAREARRRIQDTKERLWRMTRPEWLVRQKVKERYLYLGPRAETYIAWKLRLDPVYAVVGKQLSRQGRVLDLGCGYGIMSHWAAVMGYERPVVGVDDDEKKIGVARATQRYQRHLSFVCADILDWNGELAESVIMLDILHYSRPEVQIRMLQKGAAHLAPGGTLFVREAVQAAGAYKATQSGEVFSTGIGFNKKRDGLFFADMPGWKERFRAAGLEVESAEPCGLGKSNHLFILRHRK